MRGREDLRAPLRQRLLAWGELAMQLLEKVAEAFG
jgi:hypothetical protein